MTSLMRAVSRWGWTALPVVWAACASRPGRLAGWEAALCLTVLAAAVWLARARPVGALLLISVGWQVVFLSRAPVDGTVGAVVLAAGLVAVSFLAGRRATAGHHGVPVLIIATAGAVAAALVVRGAADTAVAAAVGMTVLAVVPWLAGRYRRQYTQMVEAGWDRAEQLERDAEHAANQARERERARLAAEIHDLVGHQLAQAALRVGALEVSPHLPEEHRDAARGARASVTAAAERLADAIRVLRAEEDEPVVSVEEVAAGARRSGLVVDLTVDGLGETDPVITRTIHRVTTEAITNSIKHAPGAPVAIRLERSAHAIDLRVTNGPPRRSQAGPPSGGHGLVALGERVLLVGGRFDAGPQADGGFEVAAHLPDKPVTTTVPGEAGVRRYRTIARQQVRHSARRTVLAAAALSAGVVTSVLGYHVVDAATSVIEPADYDRIRVGQPESEIAGLLPARTRVDNPDLARPAPAGATCRYYSTHRDPFDGRRRDLYRLCFHNGRLVEKALFPRDP